LQWPTDPGRFVVNRLDPEQSASPDRAMAVYPAEPACAGGDRASTAGQAADRFHDSRLGGAGGERDCTPHSFAVDGGTGAGTGSAAGWRCAVAGQWQLDTGTTASGGTGL